MFTLCTYIPRPYVPPQRRNTVTLPLWKENTRRKKNNKREAMFSLGEELEEEEEEAELRRRQSFRCCNARVADQIPTQYLRYGSAHYFQN